MKIYQVILHYNKGRLNLHTCDTPELATWYAINEYNAIVGKDEKVSRSKAWLKREYKNIFKPGLSFWKDRRHKTMWMINVMEYDVTTDYDDDIACKDKWIYSI